MQTRAVALCALTLFGLTACSNTQNPPPPAAAAPVPATQPAEEQITVAPPTIPPLVIKLTDFGGNGDGKTFNTQAFSKAVASLKAQGGGTLDIPPGVYLTLPFILTSHMDLNIEAGATIKFPETFAEWGLPDPAHTNQEDVDDATSQYRALIGGQGLTDIAITGGGTIDGSGAIWWIWSDKAARRYPPGRLVYPRPRMIVLRDCQRIHVEGVTLTNSPMFHLVPSHCQDVLIENIRIVAPSDAPNTDAIDPTGHRIWIRNCEIDTGDDNVALNGTPGGTQDVIVEYCACLHGHGISIGSPTIGGVHHLIVRHCSFDGGDNGIRIKSYRGRGGLTDDIRYYDLTMKNVGCPIYINMLYNGNANVKTDIGPRAADGHTENIPEVRDVQISDVAIFHSVHAGRILGLPEKPAQDIILTNVKIDADDGFLVQDAKNIQFNNVTLNIHTGPPLITDNAQVNWTQP
jgi:polygalacturonase